MKLLGLILVVVGVILLGAAAAQHFLGLSAISHLAIYLGVPGLVALLPGAWLSLRRSSTGTPATTATTAPVEAAAGSAESADATPVSPVSPASPAPPPAPPPASPPAPPAAPEPEALISAVAVEEAVLVVPGTLGEETEPSAAVEAPQATPAPQGAPGSAEGGPETLGGQPEAEQPE